ncbi:MAG TPA: DUF763 domain-containing protein [Polyangiaceae bacterium]|nr:DUF763 domain-containing protein [Polyangiaceae bacterium]
MGQRAGFADLPLHGGRVPAWLGQRMARLGRLITEAVVHHYGPDELLARLAHPFWFQAFGAVMGMDWHSSGITTSVIGALKRGLAPVQDELGIYVCGGRGRHSRKTPEELLAVAERTGADGEGLARTSRLVAKVDSAAVQDGFELYLHGFFVTRSGAWTVVQQGMLPSAKLARRYHWRSAGLTSFVDDPHAAVEGPSRGQIVNLADARAQRSRGVQLELLATGPDRVLAQLRKERPAPPPAPVPAQAVLPYLSLPAHHELREEDVVLRRLRGALAAAAERGPRDFAELLLVPGVGARTVEALAHVAEVVHGAPCRFSDPARFSLAHGGKDGHPFPVPLRVYDQTLRVLRQALDAAKLGNDDKLCAMRELDRQARVLERTATAPDFAEYVKRERRSSPRFAGKTV